MRYVFCILFVILIVALVICVYKASRSTKDIASSVEELLICDVNAPKEDFGMRGRRVNAERFLKMRETDG